DIDLHLLADGTVGGFDGGNRDIPLAGRRPHGRRDDANLAVAVVEQGTLCRLVAGDVEPDRAPARPALLLFTHQGTLADEIGFPERDQPVESEFEGRAALR